MAMLDDTRLTSMIRHTSRHHGIGTRSSIDIKRRLGARRDFDNVGLIRTRSNTHLERRSCRR